MDKIKSNIEIPIFDEFYNNSWFTSNLSILYRICKEDNLLNVENFYKTVSLNNIMRKDVDTLNLLNTFIINIGTDIEDLHTLNKETKKYKYVKNTYSIYGNKERVITKCGYKVCFYIIYIILKHLLNKQELRENITKNESIELELDFSPLIEEINQNTRLHTNNPKNENRKKKKEEEERVKEMLNKEQVNESLKNKERVKEQVNQKGSGNLISNTFGKGLGISEKGFKYMNKVSRTLNKGSKILDKFGIIKRINKPIEIDTSKVIIKKKEKKIENNSKKGCSCEKLSISSAVNQRKKERNQALQNKIEEEKTRKIIERISLKEKIKLNNELAKGNRNTFINNNNYIINISKSKKIKIPLYKLYLIYSQIAGITEKKVNNIDSFYSLFFWEPLRDTLYEKIKFIELIDNIIPDKEISQKEILKNINSEKKKKDIYKLLKYNNKQNIKKNGIKSKYILIKQNLYKNNKKDSSNNNIISIVSFLKEKFKNYILIGVLRCDNSSLYYTQFNENKNIEWEPEDLNNNILYLFEENEEENPTPSAPPLNNSFNI